MRTIGITLLVVIFGGCATVVSEQQPATVAKSTSTTAAEKPKPKESKWPGTFIANPDEQHKIVLLHIEGTNGVELEPTAPGVFTIPDDLNSMYKRVEIRDGEVLVVGELDGCKFTVEPSVASHMVLSPISGVVGGMYQARHDRIIDFEPVGCKGIIGGEPK